jgi:hypothetical protein
MVLRAFDSWLTDTIGVRRPSSALEGLRTNRISSTYSDAARCVK